MYDAIVSAVDWSDVIAGIMAVAALIAGVLIVWRGANMLLSFLDEREADREALEDSWARDRELEDQHGPYDHAADHAWVFEDDDK